MTVWKEDEHIERFKRLAPHRQGLVRKYYRRFRKWYIAQQELRKAARFLSEDEQKIAELYVLTEAVSGKENAP